MAKKVFITNKTKRNISYPCGVSCMYVAPKVVKGEFQYVNTEIQENKIKEFMEDHKKMQGNLSYKKFVEDKLIVIKEVEIKEVEKKANKYEYLTGMELEELQEEYKKVVKEDPGTKQARSLRKEIIAAKEKEPQE